MWVCDWPEAYPNRTLHHFAYKIVNLSHAQWALCLCRESVRSIYSNPFHYYEITQNTLKLQINFCRVLKQNEGCSQNAYSLYHSIGLFSNNLFSRWFVHKWCENNFEYMQMTYYYYFNFLFVLAHQLRFGETKKCLLWLQMKIRH